MVRVKICGITNLEDALFAAECGADALGFIFFQKSPRYMEPKKVGEIVAALPPFITPVGVFVNEASEEIDRTVQKAGIQAIQLHGDEPPEACESQRVPVIRAIRVDEGFDTAMMNQFPVDTFHLDTAIKGTYGGTGQTFDWKYAKQAKQFGRIVLSGGLNTENVFGAIREVEPYAVDCSSGVESEPGKKDHRKVAEFLAVARSAGE